MTEFYELQSLLVDILAEAQKRCEFHASWIARQLNWTPAQARSGLAALAHPQTGEAWLLSHVRVRCKEHDRAIVDLDEGEALGEDYVCSVDNERLGPDDIWPEVYFTPTDSLRSLASKKNVPAVR